MNVHFSDIFGIDEAVLDVYGALNVSLINDLPLFVDPFLLFNSEKSEYQALHQEIITYLSFLKTMAREGGINKGLLKEWFEFNEVKQNWLGYSLVGNGGRGLGPDFARSLYSNLHEVLSNFGDEEITKGSHLEKLCLIKEGVGKDNISDFATNLIKNFLLEYSQTFALEHLNENQRKELPIARAFFNYSTRTWATGRYTLPYFRGDFILLTPKDILAREETWINHPELLEKFQDIVVTISDEQMRGRLNMFFNSQLPERLYTKKGKPKEYSKQDKREAARKTIQKYPQVLDHYIAEKERNGDQAVSLSESEVQQTEQLFIQDAKQLYQILLEGTEFYELQESSYEATRQRISFLKDVIENKGGHRIFYHSGEPIQRETDLHILFRLTWHGSPHTVTREANDGRGPVDYKVSQGAADMTLTEFKLAKNTKLKQNLENQVKVYEAASNPTHKSFKVIFYFSVEELERVEKILTELGIEDEEHIVLIDARADNKPSGSNA